MDKRRYKYVLWVVILEKLIAYSVSVSAVNILFAKKMSMKKESSWQRVRYNLEVGVKFVILLFNETNLINIECIYKLTACLSAPAYHGYVVLNYE